MSLWSGSLIYVGLRTLAALGLALLSLRLGGRGLLVSAQLLSDAACTLFLLAYVNWELRETVGLLAAPLLAYVIAWEAFGLGRRLPAELDARDDLSASIFETLLGTWQWAWELLYLGPPLVAGGFLAFDIVAPGHWPFPSQRAALLCTPATLAPGDTLTLRMTVPHGGELGVFVPTGRFLTIVPYAPAHTPRAERFEYVERVSLPVTRALGTVAPAGRRELVFKDTGSYVFRVSRFEELSASRTCQVRFTSLRPSPR